MPKDVTYTDSSGHRLTLARGHTNRYISLHVSNGKAPGLHVGTDVTIHGSDLRRLITELELLATEVELKGGTWSSSSPGGAQ